VKLREVPAVADVAEILLIIKSGFDAVKDAFKLNSELIPGRLTEVLLESDTNGVNIVGSAKLPTGYSSLNCWLSREVITGVEPGVLLVGVKGIIPGSKFPPNREELSNLESDTNGVNIVDSAKLPTGYSSLNCWLSGEVITGVEPGVLLVGVKGIIPGSKFPPNREELSSGFSSIVKLLNIT